MEGVNNIQEILDEANGVMVARGDLGVEVPFEELPEIQKNIIKTCISRGKRVVTATQMLETMAKNPRPTRAEVSDVANAVYDGTSAIMLSGETSVGKYPVETVSTMSRIAENAERTIHYDRRRVTRLEFQNMHVSGDMKTLAISHATCSTSADLGAKCIVAFTESGSTARAVSTYRPGTLIVAATPCEQTFNRLSMSWGVKPVLVAKRPSSGTELYSLSEQAAIQTLDLRVGDIITITAGMPVGHVKPPTPCAFTSSPSCPLHRSFRTKRRSLMSFKRFRRILVRLLTVVVILATAGSIGLYGYRAVFGYHYDSSLSGEDLGRHSGGRKHHEYRPVRSGHPSGDEKSHSDCMMIVTIDNTRGKIKLSSLMRDSLVEIDGVGRGQAQRSLFPRRPEPRHPHDQRELRHGHQGLYRRELRAGRRDRGRAGRHRDQRCLRG